MNLPKQNNAVQDMPDAPPNLLPYDGMVQYYGPILNSKAADDFFQLLMLRIAWQHDEAVIFGKRIATKREVAWYGNLPYAYTYSKTTKYALPWIEELLQLRHWVECWTGETFNSCLLNLYHDGSEGMAWHSDGEKDLKQNGAIASLSLGAERRFLFKHKQTGEKVEVQLEHGSLLLMKDVTQSHWLHHLPLAKRIRQLRISLTFRIIADTGKAPASHYTEYR